MTTEEDPPRWSEGGAGPQKLTRLLSAARQDVPTDAELSALDSRLGALLDASPATASATAVPALVKVVAGTAIALLIGGGAWSLRQRDTRVATKLAASAPTSPELALGAAPSASSVATSAPPPAAIAVEPSVPPVNARPTPATGGSASLREASSAGSNALNPAQSEASLLELARSQLSRNPTLALATAQLHAKRFPNGVLTQEREVIAISALRRLGRNTEADARAARFAKLYPSSAHQHEVDSSPLK